MNNSLWEMLIIVFLGLMAAGNIESLSDSLKNVGAFGTSTGEAVSLLFFLGVIAFIFVLVKNYFD